MLLPILLATQLIAQTPLQKQIAAIAAEAHGKVSVACSLPGTALNCDLNPHAHPPLQSVFKFPLVLTTLHLIEQGKWTLDQPIRFLASDRMDTSVSPLRDKYPAADVDVPMRELLHLSVTESDNIATDVILRTIGGPKVVNGYMKSLGVKGFYIHDSEGAMHKNVALQYRNWFEPAGAVQLLTILADHSPLNGEHTALLKEWMKPAPGRPLRLKGSLPPDTVVIHKSGSSDTVKGFTNAWNDIGLIVRPDGRQLAIAVFITDSTADQATRDGVIARIAKAAYDAASN